MILSVIVPPGLSWTILSVGLKEQCCALNRHARKGVVDHQSSMCIDAVGSCPAVLDICWGEGLWVGNDTWIYFLSTIRLEIQVDRLRVY